MDKLNLTPHNFYDTTGIDRKYDERNQRRWSYIYPGENDEVVTVVLNENEILREYFGYWSAQMIKVDKGFMISEERCIEDWTTIHWAQREP